LQKQLDARKEPLTAALWELAPAILDPDETFFGAQSNVTQQFQSGVQPQVNGARQESTAALRLVQQRISPEQWAKLPQEIRGLVQQGGGRGGGTQGFNAVGTLDRMLANPLLVMIDLKEILRFTPEQLTGLQEVSISLQEKLNERRQRLGQRFDNVPPAQQAQIFQQIQPQIEEGRDEVRAALKVAEGLLTPEQWTQVPAAVRDPFSQPVQVPGGGRGGGGGAPGAPAGGGAPPGGDGRTRPPPGQ
jgi:hypothetical protein